MEYVILVVEIVLLVGLSAIFSGLNISLMSLKVADLRRQVKLGNKNAIKVLPYREKAHLSLAAILFANIAAVSATSLILEPYFHGILAGLVTTILIVIFGEVLPQAFFVRFALRFCGLFAPFLQLTIWITFIFSKPIQLLLNRIIAAEEKNLHSRAEIGMIVSEHQLDTSSELDADEVEIIRGALQLSEKRVGDIMEPIEEVYWLKNTAILNEETVDEIKEKGYSRVPIFNDNLTDCYGVLLMKDMVDIDFDDEPRAVLSFPLHRTVQVGRRTALDTMLRKFIALRTHLVPIEKDDRIVGILTVEDLIEEIIGHEIADETDRLMHRE